MYQGNNFQSMSYCQNKVQYLSTMIRILIFTLLATQIFTQVPPPIWAETFYQAFVQSYTTTHLHITGKVYYDSKKDVQRVDRVDGQHEILCGSVLPNVTSPCTHIVKDKKRYIVYPERRMCCFCCDEAHGCGVTKRDWLSQAKYEGEQVLSGESFYKWSLQLGTYTDYYYATKSIERIPRRLLDNTSKRTVDFIMNTYSTEPIADSVFALPSYCNSTCPSTTICGKIQSMEVSQI